MTELVTWMLLAALAGGLGSVARFVLDGAVTAAAARRPGAPAFPWGILLVNLSGSLLIGLLTGLASSSEPMLLVIGVGLLGGYTTFSTASFDTVRLLQRGQVAAALLNGIAQLGAAVLLAAFGLWMGLLLGG